MSTHKRRSLRLALLHLSTRPDLLYTPFFQEQDNNDDSYVFLHPPFSPFFKKTSISIDFITYFFFFFSSIHILVNPQSSNK